MFEITPNLNSTYWSSKGDDKKDIFLIIKLW